METLILLAFVLGAIYLALTRWVVPKRCPGCGRATVSGRNVCPFCRTPYRRAPLPSDGAPAHLKWVARTGEPHHYSLKADNFEIGRAPYSNLCVQDPSVADHHAVIVRRGRDYVIYDRNSGTGTYVNGSRVSAQILRSGDRIGVGSSVFIFETRRPALELSVLPLDRVGESIKGLTMGHRISGAGALLALICFFLPWIVMSCGVQVSMSGLDLATSPTELDAPSWILLLVPLMAGAIMWTLYHVLDRPGAAVHQTISRILAFGSLGLLPIVLTYLAVQRVRHDPANLGFGALIHLEYGFWGTALGFVTSIFGALLGRREAR